ncbi:MAG: response regulator [Terriglobia bacterium]
MGSAPQRVSPALRVLAVDSDATFLTAVKRVVESGRCRVDCAATGPEALDYLHRHQYDLVIADLRMPQLDATQLYAQVAARVRDGMRLLFVAAEAPTAELQAFLDEQRFHCLPKPLHLRRFLDRLDDLLFLPLQPSGEENE